MAYEFSQVEADFTPLSQSELAGVIPSKMGIDKFKDQLREGHLALLNDCPSVPMFISESASSGVKTWAINTQATDIITPSARHAFASRTKMNGFVGGGGSGNLNPAAPMPPYTPEPVIPSAAESPAALNYEYCFEVGCSEETLRSEAHTQFALGKTEKETLLGDWQTSKTAQGTLYKVHAAENEPKRLAVSIGSARLGLSPLQPVTVNSINSNLANEAFIPIIPTVKRGLRLGLPTQGYFYHFHEKRLIQEYRVIGDGNWSFYATKTTSTALNPERGYNKNQTAILVYWKLAGKVVEDQYLVYLDKQIERDELDAISEAWLQEHGVELTLPSLLAAIKEPAISRGDANQHTEAKTSKTGFPPQPPKIYNTIANSYYDHRERFLSGGTVKSLNQASLGAPDIALVRVKDVTPYKVFAKSCNQPHGCVDAGHEHEPVDNFGPWSFFFSQANASPVAVASTIQTAEALSAMAGSAGMAGNPQEQQAQQSAALQLDRMAGTLKDKIVEGYRWKVEGIQALFALQQSFFGDDTQYTEDELRETDTVQSRIRVQITEPEAENHYPIVRAYHVNDTRIPVKYVGEENGQLSVSLEENGPTIYWTPTDKGEASWQNTPDHDDGFEKEDILVTPIHSNDEVSVTTLPMPEEQDWRDAILVFPESSGIAPLYVVYSNKIKNKAKPLEVGTYGELAPRSVKDGMDIDHIPSYAAIKKYFEDQIGRELKPYEAKELLKSAVGIAIPTQVHRKCSETYGGRNQKPKQATDSSDLKTAVDSNFDAIEKCLKNEGYSSEQLDDARKQIHELNRNQGWY